MLKVHIGLNLASQLELLWAYSWCNTELWKEFLCETVLPLLHLILFSTSKRRYLWSRQKRLVLNKATETVSLQAQGKGSCQAQSPLAGCIPTSNCIPTSDCIPVAGCIFLCLAVFCWALQFSRGQKPSAGISPKDGTEHGLSFLVMRLKTRIRGFVYETKDPLASGIISWRNRKRLTSVLSLEKLLFTKAVPVGI